MQELMARNIKFEKSYFFIIFENHWNLLLEERDFKDE